MTNINALLSALALAVCIPVSHPAICGEQEDNIASAVQASFPGVSGIGKVKVEKLTIDDKKKTVTVIFNDRAGDVPISAERLKELKCECLQILGENYSKYKVVLMSRDRTFDEMVRFAHKKVIGPKEKGNFVLRKDAEPAPAGLDGSNIALWQSHGWYFEPKLNRWEWQRARIMQTVEDLYTQSYVMSYLMPMLENAGAYVMSPRERDINLVEIIADNDGGKYATGKFEADGNWIKSDSPAFTYSQYPITVGVNPFRNGTALKTKGTGNSEANAKAIWKADIPETGNYAIYVSYVSEPGANEHAKYLVHAANGTKEFEVNQKMGGGTWIYLGHFPLVAGSNIPVVELLNSGKGIVSADAVKIGGGMGNVARIVKEPLDNIDYEYVLSDYPRFTEGARYFLQWAGAPDSVYTPSDNINDYTDDYRSRGLWVNWLAGGSSMLPKQKGLNIPVDLSFAFHSDAGTTYNDSIIGTLGIYCTKGDKYANGSSRLASRDYTDLVITQITEDVRKSFEPNWTRRGMWDQSYFEARVPEVPAMLLELLSHQNFADMGYGLDPAFRFVVSRAIYKGMLKFLAHRDGRPYVVQPLPVRSFAISKTTDNQYRLSWKETVDSLEETAKPSYYIIEERLGDNVGFKTIAKSEVPEYTITVSDSDIHSYRIIAGNDGGVSFPSEVLALCDMPGTPVTIVNGFTRVSAPDRFVADSIAGFYDTRDHGVPYINDISFIGSQFEFRRNIPWMDDDAAGFGASRANYEDKVIAGNTFDYVYRHGKAIKSCGYPFVSSSVEAFCSSTDKPSTVDLILGKQKEVQRGRGAYGTYYKAFPTELQNRIASLTATGTNFFISGAYVATDIWDNPYSSNEVAEADKKFAADILGYKWRVGQASVTGEAYEVATRFKDFGKGEFKFYNELNPDCYVVESPDSFYSSDGKRGCTFMRYKENNLIAGTIFDAGNYRTVVIGFPFETIKNEGSRKYLMMQVLDFFNNPAPIRQAKN